MTAPTYTIDFADISVDPTNKKAFLIAPGELNTTATSLRLPGAGYAPYGEPIVEDLLHILENFASPVSPANPTVGQLWFDTASKLLKVLNSITTVGSTVTYDWARIANNTTLSTTAPADHSQLWYDTSASLAINHTLKIYNTISSTWQPVVPPALVKSNDPPANTGSLWYNTANGNPIFNELHVYSPVTSTWIPAASHQAALLVGNILDVNLTTSNIGGHASSATNATNATNAVIASQAVKLQTGRSITLSNGAGGSAVFDGTSDVVINVSALNANVLGFGTVPVERLGSSGTRAAGYYLAGNNVWTPLPPPPVIPPQIDAYTKLQSNALYDQKVNRDGITWAGFASDNTGLPYFRRTTDNGVYYLQPRLGYTPAPVSNTLAGYGIVDAYTKAEVNSLIPVVPPITGVLGISGWTRLPNQLTLQWGQGPALADDQSAFINLYLTGFILNVQITALGVATSGIGPCWMTDSWTTTNFRVSNNYNSGPARAFCWFAITATP